MKPRLRRAAFTPAAFVLGAVLATTAVSAAGQPSPTPRGGGHLPTEEISFAVVKGGSVRGLIIVVAQKQVTRGVINVYWSLHGLPVRDGASTTILVAASKKPCSQSITASKEIVLKTSAKTTTGNSFKTARVRLRAPLGDAKSVRIFDMIDPAGRVQLACGAIRAAPGPPA
jgi:hypothetical protein